jgi:hypothetical protein
MRENYTLMEIEWGLRILQTYYKKSQILKGHRSGIDLIGLE